VSPIDGRLPIASSRPSRQVSSLTHLKATGRWGFFRSRLCSSSSAAAVVGVGDAELHRQAQDLGA
jgi:hypothetical protein